MGFVFSLLLLLTTSAALTTKTSLACAFQLLVPHPERRALVGWDTKPFEERHRLFDRLINTDLPEGASSKDIAGKRIQNIVSAAKDVESDPKRRRSLLSSLLRRVNASDPTFEYVVTTYQGGEAYIGPTGRVLWIRTDGQIYRTRLDEFGRLQRGLSDHQRERLDTAVWTSE